MSDLIDRCNLRLMRIEECAGHTIEYALGWKACIEWMKTLPSAQPDVPDISVGDMISRQVAVDALDKLDYTPGEWAVKGLTMCKDAIKAVPSAQPEWKTFSSMTDIEFEKWLYVHGICHPDVCESIPCRIVPLLIDDAINELLSAQSEQKVGKWIEGKCSECGEHAPYWSMSSTFYESKFCPNCGAKMVVME